MNSADRQISRSKAAEMLKISQATLKNWVKMGLIENKNGFSEENITNVLRSIRTGKIKKLNSRANKRSSSVSVTGSFYTPACAVHDIISSYKIRKGSKICDPCCGTGRFLLSIAEMYGNDVQLYGYDTDMSAISSILKELKFVSSESNIIHSDSLKIREIEKYDYIFTNPPWGAHYSGHEKKELKKIYPEAGSSDSLEFFILKGLESLKNKGIMSYLLPESFFYVKRFSKIREFLLKNTKILFLKNYGRIFPGVFTQVVRLDIKKEKPIPCHLIKTDSKQGALQQIDLLTEPFFSFNAEISPADRKLISKIYSLPHYTLKGRSEWSLGIVTGNNKEFVSVSKSDGHTVPVIKGGNIKPYRITGALSYLKNDLSRMQQVPKKMLFSEKKLFYRFISDRLVFACDETGLMSLNSANVLIPHIPGYSTESVSAILNSDLMNFVYKKSFNSLKVLRSYLEMLPFPKKPDRSLMDLIENKVRLISTSYGEENALDEEINSLIYKLYGVEK